jgi:hypothetical protein
VSLSLGTGRFDAGAALSVTEVGELEVSMTKRLAHRLHRIVPLNVEGTSPDFPHDGHETITMLPSVLLIEALHHSED